MGLFSRKESKPALFDVVLDSVSAEDRKEVKAHFSGMGNHEICALFRGPHWEPGVKKINQYCESKPKQIRVYGLVDINGGCIYYIRGTFAKEDVALFSYELTSCFRKGDSLLSEPEWIAEFIAKELGQK